MARKPSEPSPQSTRSKTAGGDRPIDRPTLAGARAETADDVLIAGERTGPIEATGPTEATDPIETTDSTEAAGPIDATGPIEATGPTETTGPIGITRLRKADGRALILYSTTGERP